MMEIDEATEILGDLPAESKPEVEICICDNKMTRINRYSWSCLECGRKLIISPYSGDREWFAMFKDNLNQKGE